MGLLSCETNTSCDGKEETVRTALEDIYYLFDEEKEFTKLLCSTPNVKESDGTLTPLGISICAPNPWCDGTYDQGFNVEYDGVRDVVVFDGCSDDDNKPVDKGAGPPGDSAVRLFAGLTALVSAAYVIWILINSSKYSLLIELKRISKML